MSLYRCAACGSPNVVKHEEKDGFSYKKAIAGTVVFGAIGAVAGIDGKTKEVYNCPDCGASLPEPMDSITQAKIDSVMIAPDTLVPMVFPDMYERYAYLRNEHEQKRAIQNAEELSKLTTVSSVQQNPLNVSEEEFRQSAKDVAKAFKLLDSYLTYYDKHGMPNFTSGKMAVINNAWKFKPDAKDIAHICQSFEKMKYVVYALSFYRNLIHDEENLKTGLSRSELTRLLFIYVLMGHKEITCSDFYDYVNDNSMLKQAFMLVINMEKYEDQIRREQRIADLSPDPQFYMRSQGRKKWFSCLDLDCACPILGKKRSFASDFEWWYDLGLFDMETLLKCRISIFDNTLHFLNNSSPEVMLEKELPELAHEIKSKEAEVSQKQELYEKLTTDQPSSEEQKMAQQISANQASIQELQKVKLFGKKKALEKAEDLAKENERLKAQLEALKAARMQENKKASEEIRNQLETLKKELAELQIPMNDFIRSVRWLPVK